MALSKAVASPSLRVMLPLKRGWASAPGSPESLEFSPRNVAGQDLPPTYLYPIFPCSVQLQLREGRLGAEQEVFWPLPCLKAFVVVASCPGTVREPFVGS